MLNFLLLITFAMIVSALWTLAGILIGYKLGRNAPKINHYNEPIAYRRRLT